MNDIVISAVVATLAFPFAATQCAGPGSTRLCCQSFEPFSDNADVWEACGIPTPSDPDAVEVGSLCEESNGTWWAQWIRVRYDVSQLTNALCSPTETKNLCCASVYSGNLP
ncbi:hypothetical protein PsYK624_082740 [Phanerochaete sordida]|uniref:Hydrophobin n=1 Tax=Phanerochaete sordida TaxID=48140 RepID=A0A9P3GC23_9APHY|nr:hypothetical protein PsYK624_082740 [Phanerochaete sordida]